MGLILVERAGFPVVNVISVVIFLSRDVEAKAAFLETFPVLEAGISPLIPHDTRQADSVEICVRLNSSRTDG